MDARETLLAAARHLDALGHLPAMSGNLSVRLDHDRILMTPTALPYAAMAPADLVVLDLAGTVLEGRRRPSSEAPMHTGVYRRRPEVRAVVHGHPRQSTALAVLRAALPPVHYTLGLVATDGWVPVAPYALYGTEELAGHAADALDGRQACLLANHGLLAVGGDLDEAVNRAVVVEEVAGVYLTARAAGEPHRLTPPQFAEAAAKIAGYGKEPPPG